MKKTYFITGAAGFVGRKICSQLISQGHEVRALVRKFDQNLEASGVCLSIGSFDDESLLAVLLSEVDCIVHCAGTAEYGNGAHYYNNNLELTRKLVRSVEDFSPRARFIFISTIGAIDRLRDDSCKVKLDEGSLAAPSSDYGKSKILAEEVVRNSNLQYVIVRPTMVVGAEMRANSHFAVFARMAIRKSFFSRVRWPGQFSVIHVDDLASAVIFLSNCVHAKNDTFFCSGDEISIGNFFDLCNPKISRVSLSLFFRLFEFFTPLMPFRIKVLLLPALTASDEKLRQLGWSPIYKGAAESLEAVINREKSRLNPFLDPGGQVVITGAASGLGEAIALFLAPIRKRMLLIDKDRKALEELRDKILCSECTIYILDLSSESELFELVASKEWNAHPIVELYACAGIGGRGLMQDIDITTHIKSIQVNLISRILLGKAAISSMLARHFGRVILISSSSAFQPLPLMATYAGTNASILSIGLSWAEEVSKEGVDVMTVCPGGMSTNFQKNNGVREIKGERLMRPEAVVLKIMTGIQKARPMIIVSTRSKLMSLLARVLPREMQARLWFKLMGKMR